MKTEHTLSAIVPVYNDGALLPGAVRELDRALAGRFADYEIIIIESGSTDDTGVIADRLAGEFTRVRVHHEGRRNGFGSAVRAGYALASKQWVWLIVVDLPFRLDAIDAAIPLLDRYDCILSYRSRDSRSRYRRVQSAIFNRLARALLGVRVRHINSAFKLIRSSLVHSIPLTSRGWLLDAELVAAIERRGVPYIELPVELIDRSAGQSTVGAGAAARTFLDLLALARRERKAG